MNKEIKLKPKTEYYTEYVESFDDLCNAIDEFTELGGVFATRIDNTIGILNRNNIEIQLIALSGGILASYFEDDFPNMFHHWKIHFVASEDLCEFIREN